MKHALKLYLRLRAESKAHRETAVKTSAVTEGTSSIHYNLLMKISKLNATQPPCFQGDFSILNKPPTPILENAVCMGGEAQWKALALHAKG